MLDRAIVAWHEFSARCSTSSAIARGVEPLRKLLRNTGNNRRFPCKFAPIHPRRQPWTGPALQPLPAPHSGVAIAASVAQAAATRLPRHVRVELLKAADPT